MPRIPQKLLLASLLGFLLGVAWVFSMRFILYMPDEVHYHANFGVFINGQREMFTGPGYYEEVSACSQDESANPRGRVHMHQPDSDVVHVHDAGATWGNLFENIGLNLTNGSVQTAQGIFIGGQGGELVFMLNGQRTRSIANVVIGDEDRLLISFGPAGADLQTQYDQVADTAGVFNESYDPAGCTSSNEPTLTERFKHAISF